MKDDKVISVPEDLDALSEKDLHELMLNLQARVRRVEGQLVAWDDGRLPVHMQSDDWRRRANTARLYLGDKIARVQVALRTHQSRRWRAFGEAAKRVLEPDVIEVVWDVARQLYPELFPDETLAD